jgi:hypothetical protein
VRDRKSTPRLAKNVSEAASIAAWYGLGTNAALDALRRRCNTLGVNASNTNSLLGTMISETSKKWIEAGKLLGKEPTATVRCPHCGKANLKVEDIPQASKIVERRMHCPSCLAENFLLFGSNIAH